MALADVMQQFDSCMKDFIISKSAVPPYAISKVAPNNYDVDLNVPGSGSQKLTVIIDGSELTIKGKINSVGDNPNIPYIELQSLINGAVVEWIGQSAERIAISEAKSAAADATLKFKRPIHAVVKLMPSGTTSDNVKEKEPIKVVTVSSPANPVSSALYKR